jgi:hypothetical protein
LLTLTVRYYYHSCDVISANFQAINALTACNLHEFIDDSEKFTLFS